MALRARELELDSARKDAEVQQRLAEAVAADLKRATLQACWMALADILGFLYPSPASLSSIRGAWYFWELSVLANQARVVSTFVVGSDAGPTGRSGAYLTTERAGAD